jgi:hypothetical protein
MVGQWESIRLTAGDLPGRNPSSAARCHIGFFSEKSFCVGPLLFNDDGFCRAVLGCLSSVILCISGNDIDLDDGHVISHLENVWTRLCAKLTGCAKFRIHLDFHSSFTSSPLLLPLFLLK